MELKAGEKLGRYQIISPIGEGGMGEVWKARDTQLDHNRAQPGRRQSEQRAQSSLSVFPSGRTQFPLYAPWRAGQIRGLNCIARQPQTSGKTAALRCQSRLRATAQRAARLSLLAARSDSDGAALPS
jgi:serine/threonine protein kinase